MLSATATEIHFMRHAHHALVGTGLAGRTDIGLSPAGRFQARSVAHTLKVDRVFSSPRGRALQTAAAIAAHRAVDVLVDEGLDELDFGGWTARSFADLASDPDWQRWNAQRAVTRPPSGESMAEAARRMRTTLMRIADGAPGLTVVAVSHAEPMRALLLDLQGRSFDRWAEIELPPCARLTLKATTAGIQPVKQELVP